MVGVLVGSIALLADFFLRFTFWGGGRRSRSSDSNGGGGLQIVVFVVAIVLAILAPILARLVQLAISRQREYLADASGVELTRNPVGPRAGAREDRRSTPSRSRSPTGRPSTCTSRTRSRRSTASRRTCSRPTRRSSTGSTASARCRASRRSAAPSSSWASAATRRARTRRLGRADLPGRPASREASEGPLALSLVRRPWYSAPRRRALSGTRVRAEIAQLVEHATENRGVASSNLALGTINRVGASSGSGSVGRASPCQGEGRGFESRLPLQFPPHTELDTRHRCPFV